MDGHFSQFIGLRWNIEVNEKDLLESTGMSQIRVLYPDSIMTMDYRHDRLNVFLLEDDTIASITIG